MKRTVALLCAVGLLCTACGNADVPEGGTTTATTEGAQTATTTIAASATAATTTGTESVGVAGTTSAEVKGTVGRPATTTTTKAGTTATVAPVNVPTDNIVPFGTAKGTITATDTTFESEHFRFHIAANVYLVEGFAEKFEKLYDVMEKVSGLTFKAHSPSFAKLTVVVTRETHPGASADCEVGPAYAAGFGREVKVSPGDLFLGLSYTVIHELAHVLQNDTSLKTFNKVLSEGFAEYTTYKVLKYLQQHDREFGALFSPADACVMYMDIADPNNLYKQSVQYWMEHDFPFEYASNCGYAVGFRLMSYLDAEYGSYTKWLTEYQKRYAYTGNSDSAQVDFDKQVQVVTDAYGAACYDGFYPWVKRHEAQFAGNAFTIADYRHLSQLIAYPRYYHSGFYESVPELMGMKYRDLCLSLVEYRHYLTAYKKVDDSRLVLRKSADVAVALYDANGKFLKATRGTLTRGQYAMEYVIPLDGVYYVKIFGSGETSLNITLS